MPSWYDDYHSTGTVSFDPRFADARCLLGTRCVLMGDAGEGVTDTSASMRPCGLTNSGRRCLPEGVSGRSHANPTRRPAKRTH